jgi:hypothetical protein
MNRPMSVEQWREEIGRRLDAARPARYREDDRSWMEPVYEWAEANIPPGMREAVLREPEEWVDVEEE